MKYDLGGALIVTSLLGLTACGGGSNDTPPLTGAVRVANGITDSSGLDMTIGDSTKFSSIGTAAASDIAYLPINAIGSYDAKLSSNSAAFTVTGIPVDQDKVTTIFAYGVIGSGTQGGFFAEMSLDAPNSGQFVVQPVHAALTASFNALSLNFYLVKPGVCSGAIEGVTANGSATFRASAALFTLTGGVYEICVTDAAGTVLFDSGPSGVAFPTGNANVFQIAVYDAPSDKGNGSTIMVSVLDNKGGNTALYNLKN
jgi:hypothetical protein